VLALNPVTVLLSGGKHSGKTAIATEAVAQLRQRGYKVAGILANGLWHDGVRSGFDLVDLATGQTVALARRDIPSAIVFGEFGFFEEGLKMGREALGRERALAADAVVIDEVGRWELLGGGWAKELDALMELPPRATILVVRDAYVPEIAQRWGRQDTVRFDIDGSNVEHLLAILCDTARTV